MTNEERSFVDSFVACNLSFFIICHLQIFLCVLCGREKKCSAGFPPANGPVDAKGVIQAHMPARRRRYDFSSRSATLRVFGCAVFHARPVKTEDFMTVASGNTLL